MLVFFTDGVTSSGLGKTMPDGWLREDVIRYLEQNYTPGLSPQRLADTVLSACRDLALGSPDDDVTVVAVKMRERSVVNLLIVRRNGPKTTGRCCVSFSPRRESTWSAGAAPPKWSAAIWAGP